MVFTKRRAKPADHWRNHEVQYKPVYTIEEVLHLLPVSRTRLYKAIANREIRSFRPGRRRFFTHDSVMKFVSLLEKKGGGHE